MTPSRKNAATDIDAARAHHELHGDMDGQVCLLNRCALHYPMFPAKERAKTAPVKQRSFREPKNVQAVIDWLTEHRPDVVVIFRTLLEEDIAGNTRASGLLGYILIGFEAGRVFEKANPDVRSGIDY
jgi:hypothetical protein